MMTTDTVYRHLGSSFLLIPVSLMFITSAAFLLGAAVAPWMFPCAVTVGLAYLFMVRQPLLKAITVYVATVAASLLLMCNVYEISFDGFMYHLYTVVSLKDGWVPTVVGEHAPVTSLWTLHYAKIIETQQACVVSTVGSIYAGRAINVVYIASLVCYAADFMAAKNLKKGLFVVAVASNPVLVTQFMTSYIDFYGYIFACLSLYYIIRISTRERGDAVDWVMLFCVSLLAVGTKFNIFFNQGVVLVLWLVYILYNRRYKLAGRLFCWGVALLLTVPLVFYHPYVTNMLSCGNPLYPLLGSAVDIMTDNTPDVYLDIDNRFVSFFYNLVAPWHSHAYWTVTYDSPIGGFGPFLIVILVVAALFFIKNRGEYDKAALYIIVCTFLSCFVFEQSWWARYICQLWIIVAVVAYHAVRMRKRKTSYFLATLCALTMLLMSYQFLRSVAYTINQKNYSQMLEGATVRILPPEKSVFCPIIPEILDELNVKYEVADSIDPCHTIDFGAGAVLGEVPEDRYGMISCYVHSRPRRLQKYFWPFKTPEVIADRLEIQEAERLHVESIKPTHLWEK